ncbi:MAG: hypothetical protein J6M60_04455 [Clostridia bacterium]|nr:hypothetical protein [Clostridia bacterium]
MIHILYFLIPLIFFLFFNGTLVLLTKKEFGKCIPLSFILCALIMFASQSIFNTFNIGFYSLLLFAFMSIPILLFLFIKKRNLFDDFKTKYFDKGLISFLVIYVFFYIFDLRRFFSAWDEFSHWGVMVKEMFRTDSFYSSVESTLLVHKDYPPIFQIFELFWTKLCGNYYEPNLIKSMHIFEFSLFIPVIYNLTNKNIKSNLRSMIYTLCMIAIIFLSVLLFDQHCVINTIYIDYLMALISAYAIYMILSEKEKFSYFSLFNLGMTLTFLVLLKQMGIPFYLIILFVFICDLVIHIFTNRKSIKKVQLIIPIILAIILIVIVPLVEWKCWNIFVSNLNTDQQFSLSDIEVLELPSILQGKTGEEYQTTSGNNFIQAIITQSITSSNIELSFVQASIIIICLFIVLLLIFKNDFTKGQKFTIISSVIIGFIGYTFVLLNMYVFSFGPGEGPILASFDRYMDTYIIFMLALLIILLISKLKDKKFWIVLFSLIILLFTLQSPEKLDYLVPSFRSKIITEYEYDAEMLTSSLPEKANVFILGDDDDLARQYLIKYYANPITTNIYHYKFDTSSNIESEKYINSIKNYIFNYDYLYLKNVDENFIEKYSFLFNDNIVIPETLYTINNVDDKIVFKIMK